MTDKLTYSFQGSNLFKRYKKNPILTSSMWPYKINSVFNAASTIYKDKTLLLARVEDMRGSSHLCKAISSDGFTKWKIDKHPTFLPKPDEYPEDIYGIEDPRIIKLENEDNTYAITYTSFHL